MPCTMHWALSMCFSDKRRAGQRVEGFGAGFAFEPLAAMKDFLGLHALLGGQPLHVIEQLLECGEFHGEHQPDKSQPMLYI